MKLKIKEFNDLCGSLSQSSEVFLKTMGYPDLLDVLVENNNIGYEFIKDLYNCVGEQAVRKVIDFEGGNIFGFRSKYIKIGRAII